MSEPLSYRLHVEFLAAVEAVDHLSKESRRCLWHLIGHPGQRLDVGGVGISTIAIDRRTGLYEPSDAGQRALIIAARLLPHHLRKDILDLVAVLPKSREVFRRTGLIDLLGGWLTSSDDKPPMVYPDPIAWVLGNAAGICLLDPSRGWASLGHLSALMVPDIATGRKLRQALTPPEQRRPKILVADGRKAA